MAARIAMRVLVSGLVQGVGCREFVRRAGESTGVAGWVRNLSDGRVEAHAEGEASAVRAFLDRCRRGPPASRVGSVEASPVEPEGRSGFTILASAGSPGSEAPPHRPAADEFRTPDG